MYPLQQLEEPRNAGKRSVFAKRDADHVGVAAVQLNAEIVRIEGQAHSHAGAVRPDLRRQGASRAHVMCRFLELILAPLEAWLLDCSSLRLRQGRKQPEANDRRDDKHSMPHGVPLSVGGGSRRARRAQAGETDEVGRNTAPLFTTAEAGCQFACCVNSR